MTLETTHDLIVAHAKLGNGNNNHCCIAYGATVPDFRESDLKKQWKLQHGTVFKSALNS